VNLSTETVITVPLTTFPAILGRSQTTQNKHIFDLGNCKQLSRQHAVIFFADVYGGRIGRWEDMESNDIKTEDDWMYRPPKSKTKMDIKQWIKKKGCAVPKEGFYAIECLSKNKVYVDGNRVEQGGMAILYHGSTIKMLTYTLYFLLPEEGVAQDQHPRVITVPNPMAGQDVEMDDASTGPPFKKIKKEKMDPETVELPLPELIKEFLDAIDTDKFERKHSMMSTSILQYAVQDVSKDMEIHNMCKSEGGVPRSVIMDWISNNETYSKYVAALLTKVEIKSYQQNLSRALIKGGFTRLGTTGRHVKWIVPDNPGTAVEHSTSSASTHHHADDQGTTTEQQLQNVEESSIADKEEAEKHPSSSPNNNDNVANEQQDNLETTTTTHEQQQQPQQQQTLLQEETIQGSDKDASDDGPLSKNNVVESSITNQDKSAE
jgi:FHA domain.